MHNASKMRKAIFSKDGEHYEDHPEPKAETHEVQDARDRMERRKYEVERKKKRRPIFSYYMPDKWV